MLYSRSGVPSLPCLSSPSLSLLRFSPSLLRVFLLSPDVEVLTVNGYRVPWPQHPPQIRETLNRRRPFNGFHKRRTVAIKTN